MNERHSSSEPSQVAVVVAFAVAVAAIGLADDASVVAVGPVDVAATVDVNVASEKTPSFRRNL